MKEYNIIINGKKQIMQETSGLIFLSYLILFYFLKLGHVTIISDRVNGNRVRILSPGYRLRFKRNAKGRKS